MIRFGFVLLVSAVVVGGFTRIAYQQQWIGQFPSFYFQTLIFLVFGTFIIFAYLYRLKRPDLFVTLYLLTMAVKLVAYGAYNTVMILNDREGAFANVVFFMTLYLLFTLLEIVFLYRKISRSSGP